MLYSGISGIILSGGRSSRMKTNKAFARVGGVAIIERIIPLFASAFAETIIISNEPELYQNYGVPVVTDIYPRQGPVSGIHAGLFYVKTDYAFVMSCDLPFMIPELAGILQQAIGNHDCAVPIIGGKLQPLSALYRKSIEPVFEKCLRQDHLKLTRIVSEELDAVLVPPQCLEELGDIELRFMNVNDENTLQIANQLARGL